MRLSVRCGRRAFGEVRPSGEIFEREFRSGSAFVSWRVDGRFACWGRACKNGSRVGLPRKLGMEVLGTCGTFGGKGWYGKLCGIVIKVRLNDLALIIGRKARYLMRVLFLL